MVVYYAGLDHTGLPYNQGISLINETKFRQVTFIKALTLVADYVVVPPSFYFYWTKAHQDASLISAMSRLHGNSVLLSTFYSGMNSGVDFIEYKSEISQEDRQLIECGKKLIRPFFRSLPVIHRDVVTQSAGFRDLFGATIAHVQIPHRIQDQIYHLLATPATGEVVLSRDSLHRILATYYRTGNISQDSYMRMFAAVNAAYYKQGATTYDAVVSLVGAHRYSFLGEALFCSDTGILLAYDPEILLAILAHMGFGEDVIKRLTVDELALIRDTREFHEFKWRYRSFATDLQKAEGSAKGLSGQNLLKLKEHLTAEFFSTYFREEEKHAYYKRLYNLGEMSVSSVVLGMIGLKVSPVVGLILGFLPVAAYTSGVSDKLSDYIVERISRRHHPIYTYCRKVREIIREFK